MASNGTLNIAKIVIDDLPLPITPDSHILEYVFSDSSFPFSIPDLFTKPEPYISFFQSLIRSAHKKSTSPNLLKELQLILTNIATHAALVSSPSS